MELKTKYQYTYFIYPYIVKEENYKKYLLGLLKNKRCSVKFFEKERDLDIYQFFLPKMREYMFKTFQFTNEKKKEFERCNLKIQSEILAQYPCTIFEYDMGMDAQGKVGEQSGIFFKVQKIELICFKSGICFISIKTNVEDSKFFSEVLDFNYKFSEINSDFRALKKYENINIQTNQFSDITKLSDLIKELTQNSKMETTMNVDINKFYTYSYCCIEQEFWNNNNEFKNIENEFLRFANVLPSNQQVDIDKTKVVNLENWDYAKIGISNMAVVLFGSGLNTNNYTKLPFAFENQYLYMYIWDLYQKIYMNKISKDFENTKNYKLTRKEFVDFTRKNMDTRNYK